MSQVALTSRSHGGRRDKASGAVPWGSPGTYLIATFLIACCIAPVAYIIIGGFRTNSQITTDPSGFPNPWEVENYLAVLQADPAAVEDQVMPPPTPYSSSPLATSCHTVRIATLKCARPPGVTQPIAPV